MLIIYTSQFHRGYKKLPNEIKMLAEAKEKIFRESPFNTGLKTHKLHGQFRDFWSFSLNLKYRIIFEFADGNNKAYFHSIGDHGIYE